MRSRAARSLIHPVEHASFVMTLPGMVDLQRSRSAAPAKYRGLPPPGLILVTHEHSDHFDPPTLEGIVGENTRLLTNPSVHEKLPDDLRARATAIANGEGTSANAVDDRGDPGAQPHPGPDAVPPGRAATTATC